MKNINWTENRFRNIQDVSGYMDSYSIERMKKANRFHASMPQYKETPLRNLSGLANLLDLDKVYIKDESERFDLNAFKGLGVSYAMAEYFAGVLDIDLSTLTFEALLEKTAALPKTTFVTATDGNHGKGVAWAAEIFNQNAKVYMPKGSTQSRLDAVKTFGAEGHITDRNYDDTVRYAAELSEENDWVLIQDTAWEGYSEAPRNIMQGYTTIVAEIIEQLGYAEFEEISHIFLQAGVGSFAGAIAAAVYNVIEGKMPKIIIVEPDKADCLYQSADSEEDDPVAVGGELDSMMAGLCCGEPNPEAWSILKSVTDCFVSCDDSISAKGMRMLFNPVGKDEKVVSGESGAVPLGMLYEVMTIETYAGLKNLLELDDISKVLMVSTEGDTDPDNYSRIVRDGRNAYE